MRTPLNLANGVFVTGQLYLAHATDRLAGRRGGARHATVPDLDYLVDPCTRDHKGTVLVPIYGEKLCTRGWDGEDGGRDGVGESVGRGTRCVGWCSQIEYFDRTVGRAGSDEVRLMW